MKFTNWAFIGLAIAGAVVLAWIVFAVIIMLPVVGFHPTLTNFH